MRFFAHDGTSTHGPAGIEELLKLPGFDGETFVCPAGSNDSADWKPALAYPQFKKALLEAAADAFAPPVPPISIPPIAPREPLPPPPEPSTRADVPRTSRPCPSCAHDNLEEARFCNACGARMDDRLEGLAPPPPVASVAAVDSFTHLDASLSSPAQPAPQPKPAAKPAAAGKRPAALAAFAGAAVIAALAYVALKKNAPVEIVAELTPTASMPMPQAAPPATPEPSLSTMPTPSAPMIPSPRAIPIPRTLPAPRTPRPKAVKPTRTRKPRPVRAPKPKAKSDGLTATNSDQSGQDEKDPALEALLAGATPPPAAKPSPFTLPGLQRPVSASDRAGTPRPAAEDVSPAPAEEVSAALAEVRDQFNFCAQLLAQGAYGDHYDTCLCKDAREAAPYRGRRGFYMTAKKKEASGARLGTAATVLASKIDGDVATVTVRWTAGEADRGRDVAQTWKLEDGLWCRAL